jgi:DNA-binding response OmpR family regulator
MRAAWIGSARPPNGQSAVRTDWRTLEDGPQRLLEAAQRSCERSRELIQASRETLGLHRTAVAALRIAANGGGSGSAPAVGGVRLALDLDDEVVIGSLRLLPLRRAVSGEVGRVLLTPAEWQLFAALVTNRSTVLGRSALATKAWGVGFAERHGEVEVYISRLRRKLARAGGTAVHIQTVRGQGYRLTIAGDPAPEARAPDRLADGAA